MGWGWATVLVDLARAYVTAINTGAVPTIASAWESVVRIEGVKALETAKKTYENAYAHPGFFPWLPASDA